jgi:hypothetical protein
VESSESSFTGNIEVLEALLKIFEDEEKKSNTL